MSAWAFSASSDRCWRFLNCPSARALASSDLSAIYFVPPSAACLSVAPGRSVINTLRPAVKEHQRRTAPVVKEVQVDAVRTDVARGGHGTGVYDSVPRVADGKIAWSAGLRG